MVTLKSRDNLATFRRGFVRSKRGNLWRPYRHDGTVLTLTIFKHPDGLYRFVSADNTGPTFSQARFESEAAALVALAKKLKIEGKERALSDNRFRFKRGRRES